MIKIRDSKVFENKHSRSNYLCCVFEQIKVKHSTVIDVDLAALVNVDDIKLVHKAISLLI